MESVKAPLFFLYEPITYFIIYKEGIREDGRLTRFSVVARSHSQIASSPVRC
jgi:hypothetical protein